MRPRQAVGVAVSAVTLSLVATALPATAASSYPSSGGHGHGALAATTPHGDLTVRRDARGRTHFLGTGNGAVLRRAASSRLSPLAAARDHLQHVAGQFGVASAATELRAVSSADVGHGQAVVRFQQTEAGLPVLGGQLTTALDKDNNLVAVQGETTQSVASSSFAISADAARSVALRATARDQRLPTSALQVSPPQQWLYDASLFDSAAQPGAHSVWRVEVTAPGHLDVRELVLVDATSGSATLHVNQVERSTADNKVCDNGERRNDDYLCGTGRYKDPLATSTSSDAKAAWNGAEATEEFYGSLGETIDLAALIGSDYGDGKKLRSTVRVCPGRVSDGPCPYDNAFWDGFQMVYGTNFAQADDVVAHELTHGVTQHTSGLAYWFQSGAINESMSDVFGEFVDLTDTLGSDNLDDQWVLGEDLGSFGLQRDMALPSEHDQPSQVNGAFWYSGDASFDNGGVHTNSGVGNKAAYLIVQGGPFNGQSVTGFLAGSDLETAVHKAAKLYWRTQLLLTPGSDYADLAQALETACANLVADATSGFAQADCDDTVNKAVLATDMRHFAGPQPPVDLHITGTDGQIHLTWTRPAGAPTVTSYVMEVSPAIGGERSLTLDDARVHPDVYIGGIPTSRTYTFSLVSVTADGTSLPVTRTLTGSRLTISVPTTAVYGKRTDISGSVTRVSDGAALGARSVRLYRKQAGVAGYRYIGSARTSASGRYAFRPTAVRDAAYFVRFPASSTVYLGNHTGKHAMATRQHITLKASDTAIRKGQRIHFTGKVKPGRSGTVTLQRRHGVNGAWSSVAHARLSSHSRYDLTYRARNRKDFTWRVVVRRTSVLSAGRTRELLVRVR